MAVCVSWCELYAVLVVNVLKSNASFEKRFGDKTTFRPARRLLLDVNHTTNMYIRASVFAFDNDAGARS